MDEPRGPWTIHARRVAYDNPWLEVVEHDVTRPDGKPGLYAVMCPKHVAIAILPVHADGTIDMVGQFRFATNRYEWEIPEGGGAADGDPLEEARRELKEETGLAAERWLEILRVDLSNSITNEPAIGFIAWDLTEGKAEPEGTEVIEPRRLPFLEAVEHAVKGEFRDMLTVAMLLKAHYMASNGMLDPRLSRILLNGGEAK